MPIGIELNIFFLKQRREGSPLCGFFRVCSILIRARKRWNQSIFSSSPSMRWVFNCATIWSMVSNSICSLPFCPFFRCTTSFFLSNVSEYNQNSTKLTKLQSPTNSSVLMMEGIAVNILATCSSLANSPTNAANLENCSDDMAVIFDTSSPANWWYNWFNWFNFNVLTVKYDRSVLDCTSSAFSQAISWCCLAVSSWLCQLIRLPLASTLLPLPAPVLLVWRSRDISLLLLLLLLLLCWLIDLMAAFPFFMFNAKRRTTNNCFALLTVSMVSKDVFNKGECATAEPNSSSSSSSYSNAVNQICSLDNVDKGDLVLLDANNKVANESGRRQPTKRGSVCGPGGKETKFWVRSKSLAPALSPLIPCPSLLLFFLRSFLFFHHRTVGNNNFWYAFRRRNDPLEWADIPPLCHSNLPTITNFRQSKALLSRALSNANCMDREGQEINNIFKMSALPCTHVWCNALMPWASVNPKSWQPKDNKKETTCVCPFPAAMVMALEPPSYSSRYGSSLPMTLVQGCCMLIKSLMACCKVMLVGNLWIAPPVKCGWFWCSNILECRSRMRDTCFSSTPTSPLSAAKNHCFVAAIPGKWGKGGVVEVGGFIIEVSMFSIG